MRRPAGFLCLLAPIGSAFNLEWNGRDGNRYFAEESTRFPSNCLNLTSIADGISYFNVGGTIDWPDFKQTVDAALVKIPHGAYVALSLASSVVVARAY